MAYFAKINDNNVVIQVISISNNDAPDPAPQNSESLGQNFIRDTLKLGGTWIQTSYNASFRGKYACIGDIWNGTNFISQNSE